MKYILIVMLLGTNVSGDGVSNTQAWGYYGDKKSCQIAGLQAQTEVAKYAEKRDGLSKDGKVLWERVLTACAENLTGDPA